MTTITTQRNKVVCDEPEPNDMFVRVTFTVPGDEPGICTVRHLPYEPISEYQEAVDWAVSMADKMAYPIRVMPLSPRDIFQNGRSASFRDYIAGLSNQDRGELRQMIVTRVCTVMRDCDDTAICSAMFDLLGQLEVIHYES